MVSKIKKKIKIGIFGILFNQSIHQRKGKKKKVKISL